MGICGFFNEMDTKVPEEEFIRQIISSFKCREFKIDFLSDQFLNSPIEENINNDSESDWIPKINTGLAVANQSSVPYNIINNGKNVKNSIYYK